MSAVAGDESSASAVGVSVASSSCMSRNVGRRRERYRESGKGKVLGREQSQLLTKVGRNVYRGIP